MLNITTAKKLLNTNMVETYIIKAFAILKQTEKAFLFRTEEGDCWIPLSCVQSVDLYVGKKRPVRATVVKSFKVTYTQDSSKEFLKNLQENTSK